MISCESLEQLFYENGDLKVQRFYVNGKKNGKYNYWYKNGQKMEQVFYENGKFEGEFRCWYRNGQISDREFFRNGNVQGEYKYWYSNGYLDWRWYMKDGTAIDPQFTFRKKLVFIKLQKAYNRRSYSEISSFIIPDPGK